MKVSRERREEYAEGIDKALRRAARNAELTAAATGTRLVIYEKGRIRRVRPPAKLNTVKMMRDMRTKLPMRSTDYSHLEVKELQQMRKNLEVRRAEGKHNAVTENREKYGSR